MHEDDFAAEGTVLLFVPWKKVVRNSIYFCQGHFHTFRDPKGAYQLSPHDSGPKHDSSTSLLTSQPCWDMVAIHQPSTTPSIWTIQSCTALISKQVCLKISLHVCVGPLQPFLLVRIGRGGRIVGLCTTAGFWRILHLEVCGTPVASNTCLLLCNGILAAALLIRRICLAETFLILPLSARTRLCSESATNLFTERWSRLSFREKSNVFISCPRHCSIWSFSAAERSYFFPILLETCGLLNNVESPS